MIKKASGWHWLNWADSTKFPNIKLIAHLLYQKNAASMDRVDYKYRLTTNAQGVALITALSIERHNAPE